MLADLSPFALIMLGFVAGWVVEWLIDLGLRRKRMASQAAQREQHPQEQEEAPVAAEAQPAAESEATAAPATPAAAPTDSSAPVIVPAMPGIEQEDDLASIPGVGPAYARLLRERGVLTYEDLARLDEPDLRTLVRALPSWEKVDIGAWIAEAQKRAQERQAVTAAAAASLAANALDQTGSASAAERAQDDGATQE